MEIPSRSGASSSWAGVRPRRAPGEQHIGEATDLGFIADATYDFVLSSHTIEHSANPILALTEWIRILKAGGVLILVAPHRAGTFDHRRQVTALAHLIDDFEAGTDEGDFTHLDEILRLHDLSLDPEAGEASAFEARSRRNFENRCLHHHVFDTHGVIALVDHMRLQILQAKARWPADIAVVARKPSPGELADNAAFLAAGALRHSPFPSDR